VRVDHVENSHVANVAHQAKRIDNVTKAAGQGVPALVDQTTGNTLSLDMNTAGPVVTVPGSGVALGFINGGLYVNAEDGVNPASIHAAAITATTIGANGNLIAHGGDVNVTGNAICTNVIASGNVGGASANFGPLTSGQTQTGNLVCAQLNASGYGYITGGFQVGAADAPVGGRITCREITTVGNVAVGGNLYVTGTINPPSERSLKNHVTDVVDGLDVINALKPSIYTWKDTEFRGERRHVGVYVDELADIAPDAVVERGSPEDVPTTNEDLAAKLTEGRSYEDRALIAYLVSAVQELSAQNRDLTARVTALEAKA
jgi:hypothetical protein